MIQEFHVRAGEIELVLCYTARARYLFEQAAGYPLTEMRAWRGLPSDVELPRLLWAGLEGARVRGKLRKAPWTLDEVIDTVLDDLGADERLAVLRVCIEAVGAAFRRAEERAEEAPEGTEGKAPASV